MPGPALQPTVAAGNAADGAGYGVDIDRTAKQMRAIGRGHAQAAAAQPARQTGARACHRPAVERDPDTPCDGAWTDGDPAVAGQAAPAGHSRLPRDGVSQRRQAAIRHVPRQRGGQRGRSAGRIAQSPSRGRQAEPRLPHIARGADRSKQFASPPVVLGEAGRGQGQLQGLVLWCHPARPIEPAPRRAGVAGGNLRLGAVERLAGQLRLVRHPRPPVRPRRPGQRPTACGSACSGATCGGRPARSPRASCRPCATARSSHTRAWSMSRSPPRPRAR